MENEKSNLKMLNLADLSKLTGFERRAIADKLDAANIPFQQGKQNQKLYSPKEVLPILYRTAEAVDAGNTVSEHEKEKLLLTTAKRKKAELELQERNREVVPIDEVVEIVGKEYSIIRAQFRALPSKLAKHLAVISNPEKINEMLNKNIDEILSELQADAVNEAEEIESQIAEIKEVNNE